MKLIIGGAYQGKLEYARNTYGIMEDDIFRCTDAYIDYSKPCIYGLEEYVLCCIRQGADPIVAFKEHEEQWKDSILICRDIFCGVVPLDADLRKWRQLCGRLCQYLTKNADEVIRIFCGLEQKLK